MKYEKGVYIPAHRVKTVLEALYFYRQIIGFGREAERRARNTDLYRQIDSTVEYLASKSS